MKRFILPIFLFCLLFCRVASAASYSDSLEIALPTLPEDAARVSTLNELASTFLRKDYAKAFDYTQEAVLLARKIDDKGGEANALRNRCDLYSTSGLFEQATKDALASYNLFESMKDSIGMSKALMSQGVIHFYMGETDAAIEQYEKVAQIHEIRGNNRGLLSVNNNIASALARAGRFEEALTYYLDNLQGLEDFEIPRLKGITLNNLGGIYQETKRTEKAIPFFMQAVELYKNEGDNLGLAGVYQNLAEAYLNLGQFRKSEEFINKSEALAKDSGSPTRELEVINFRAKLAEKRGNYAQALNLYQDYNSQKAQLKAKGQSDKVAKLRTAFEADKKLAQLTLERDLSAAKLAGTEAENRNQRTLIYGFILGFILLIALIVLQVRNTNIRKKINAELLSQKQEIELKNQSLEAAAVEIDRMNQQLSAANINLEATVEKRTEQLVVANENLDTFIYRASHDLRGPLGRIKGLAQVARIQEDPKESAQTLEVMNVACDRMEQVLRKLILVREIPRLKPSVAKIDMPELIHQVQDSLLRLEEFSAFEVQVNAGKHAYLNQDPKRVRIILENLLENAYIFRKDGTAKAAQAKVKFHTSDGYFFIEVEDEGIGIEPEHHDKVFNLFFRGSNRSTGNGVGLHLVHEALASMDGMIEFESEVGKYSRFRVGMRDLE